MRPSPHTVAAALLLACVVTGCDSDEAVDGPLGACEGAGASLLECPDAPLDTAEDLCFRLVRCGLLPLDEADFDWAACVGLVESLSQARFDYATSCFAVATCDELSVNGTLNRNNLPLCLEFGDQ